jgi:CarD family transcriptional regulator
MMKQFQMDDIVLYGINGVCRVSTIEKREQGSYYILTPVHKDRTKLFVPTNNELLVDRMRPMPTKQHVTACIHKALETEPKWISDTSTRKAHAKEVLTSGDEYDVLMLARSFHQHRTRVIDTGKKTTSSDNSILRSAMNHIRDEFSIALDIEPDEVDSFIGSQDTVQA